MGLEVKPYAWMLISFFAAEISRVIASVAPPRGEKKASIEPLAGTGVGKAGTVASSMLQRLSSVDCLPEQRAWLERQYPPGFNCYCFTRLWVTTSVVCLLLYLETSKTRNLNLLSALKGILDDAQNSLQHLS